MVLSVILMVIILALLVSGYWLNSDFEVERQGMLQVSSIPTGANVEVDGDAPWYQRTNTSKVLSSGEHTVKLEKSGYDTWEKTVNISEGLLYRLHYPRLFLLEREKSSVYDMSKADFITISPDRTKLLAVENSETWLRLSLDREDLSPKRYSLENVTSALDSETGTFNGKILSADWDQNSDHILMKIEYGEASEWVLLNVNNFAESVNLSKTLGDFSEIKIFDNSASTLLAVRGGNLYKIDVSTKKLSAPLVKNVVSYDHYGSEIIYSTASGIGLMKINDTEPKILVSSAAKTGESSETDANFAAEEAAGEAAEASTDSLPLPPARVFISRFYEDKYLTFVKDGLVSVYKYDNLEKVYAGELSFIPSKIKVGHDGEFITFVKDTNIATLDMESLKIREWVLDDTNYGWLDNDMIYTVADGELIVYDFDGLNRRALSSDVSPSYPVTISNNKWLYYIGNKKLIRETIN